MDRLGGLVVIVPARRAGDPGSNPGPGFTVSSGETRSLVGHMSNYH